MDAVNKLLDKVREVRSLASDAALAEAAGVSRQLVSQWRKGANPLSDERIAQLADLAEEEPGRWFLAVHAEQANGKASKVWANLAKQLATAAALVLMAGASALPSPAGAKEGHQGLISAVSVYYVKWLLGLFRRRPALALSPA